ncbi:MAG TPA: hypothetical protein VGZ22_25610 [Isosphaeraceae bacterium]|nr:hypothetical protein [Isosphaeraceae bacterium]
MDTLTNSSLPSVRFDQPEGTTRPNVREPEAPDRGDCEREAPEARIGRQAEAPDAGEGRPNILENDFTHGRSQS